MRAREGLADCLSLLGEHDLAIEHYRDMLRLNPSDNQGIRYNLLSSLLETNNIDAAEDLLAQFPGEYSAVWLFTRALITFIRQGDSVGARQRLKEAKRENPYVIPYLLGQRPMPDALPEYIGFGDEDEAVAYVAEYAGDWLDTPRVLQWLKASNRKKKEG